MQSALHLKTQVLPGNKIEIQSDNLKIGDTVDVFVITEKELNQKQNSIQDILQGLEGQEIFKTSQEVDEYLQRERETWEN